MNENLSLYSLLDTCRALSHDAGYQFKRKYYMPLGIDPIEITIGYKSSHSVWSCFDSFVQTLAKIETDHQANLDRYCPGWRESLIRDIEDDLNQFIGWANRQIQGAKDRFKIQNVDERDQKQRLAQIRKEFGYER